MVLPKSKRSFLAPFLSFWYLFSARTALQEKRKKNSKHAKRLLELDVLQRKVGRFGRLIAPCFFLRPHKSGIGEESKISLSQ